MIFIILPVKNESSNIKRTAEKLITWSRRNLKEFQIIFINDHSTDETAKEIKKLGFEHIRLIENDFEGGKGSALKSAFLKLRLEMNHSDIVIFLDGDGQIDITDITPFVHFMEIYNAPAVIGNKRHVYSVTKYKPLRTIISLTYNTLIRLLFDIKYQDTQCGIKMFRVSALDKVIRKVSTKGYAFDIELLIALKENSIRIVDAPVCIADQTNRGSVSIKSIIQTFNDTITIWKKYKKGLYK